MSPLIKPGRELDALVAEKVMGWTQMTWAKYYSRIPDGDYYKGRRERTKHWHNPDSLEKMRRIDSWHPSTGLADAWEVQAKFPRVYVERDIAGEWSCEIWDGDDLLVTRMSADTAPHAICLAALEAIENAPAH